jgi:hypothetical protein
MTRFAAPIALAIFLCACASEAERYKWNLTHAYVCPKVRFLTRADVDEISRLVAHATPQVIMAINSVRGSRTKLDVTTSYRGVTWSESRDVFGFCTVEKSGHEWKVTFVATDLDPALAYATACADFAQ